MKSSKLILYKANVVAKWNRRKLNERNRWYKILKIHKMSVFDFFAKKDNAKREEGKLDVLKPQICAELIDDAIIEELSKVNWSQFHTAYGNAENSVPYYLKNIFCANEDVALEATHQLWCSICHQGVNMADAALPSYEILKTSLVKLSDKIRAEVLDIFAAFALCTSKEYFTVPNELVEWEKEIQQKLLRDKSLFRSFEQVNNEYIANTAKLICSYLENQKD
ncbi:hypothetical protein [Hymenobacter cheonanensis]|uniref:hypothetical protein n=1 Tax=Hymenobacter sp. CA2-7 TaxID=3063993 RepID=UPI00271346EA|nr:hypothetical protein [Hymenobacter sp. CA2-7]MDO7886555.1 hypothetical protein [Hymenobacter sp. CA2-7]